MVRLKKLISSWSLKIFEMIFCSDDIEEARTTDDDSLPIIVLHPGSKWLRLGLATTPEPCPIATEVTAGGGPQMPSINPHPKKVLHAVARCGHQYPNWSQTQYYSVSAQKAILGPKTLKIELTARTANQLAFHSSTFFLLKNSKHLSLVQVWQGGKL